MKQILVNLLIVGFAIPCLASPIQPVVKTVKRSLMEVFQQATKNPKVSRMAQDLREAGVSNKTISYYLSDISDEFIDLVNRTPIEDFDKLWFSKHLEISHDRDFYILLAMAKEQNGALFRLLNESISAEDAAKVLKSENVSKFWEVRRNHSTKRSLSPGIQRALKNEEYHPELRNRLLAAISSRSLSLAKELNIIDNNHPLKDSIIQILGSKASDITALAKQGLNDDISYTGLLGENSLYRLAATLQKNKQTLNKFHLKNLIDLSDAIRGSDYTTASIKNSIKQALRDCAIEECPDQAVENSKILGVVDQVSREVGEAFDSRFLNDL